LVIFQGCNKGKQRIQAKVLFHHYGKDYYLIVLEVGHPTTKPIINNI